MDQSPSLPSPVDQSSALWDAEEADETSGNSLDLHMSASDILDTKGAAETFSFHGSTTESISSPDSCATITVPHITDSDPYVPTGSTSPAVLDFGDSNECATLHDNPSSNSSSLSHYISDAVEMFPLDAVILPNSASSPVYGHDASTVCYSACEDLSLEDDTDRTEFFDMTTEHPAYMQVLP